VKWLQEPTLWSAIVSQHNQCLCLWRFCWRRHHNLWNTKLKEANRPVLTSSYSHTFFYSGTFYDQMYLFAMGSLTGCDILLHETLGVTSYNNYSWKPARWFSFLIIAEVMDACWKKKEVWWFCHWNSLIFLRGLWSYCFMELLLFAWAKSSTTVLHSLNIRT
jgi:hypothetical protein